MDPLTRFQGRLSLLYLGAGFVLGAALMIGEGMGAGWIHAWSGVHAHVLFVGWFVQFAVGIGYWLLPRRKTPEYPYGYNTTLAFLACGLVNAGLLLRIIFEPLYNTAQVQGAASVAALGLSGVLQAAAGLIWAFQLWRRFFLRYSASNRPAKKEKSS